MTTEYRRYFNQLKQEIKTGDYVIFYTNLFQFRRGRVIRLEKTRNSMWGSTPLVTIFRDGHKVWDSTLKAWVDKGPYSYNREVPASKLVVMTDHTFTTLAPPSPDCPSI